MVHDQRGKTPWECPKNDVWGFLLGAHDEKRGEAGGQGKKPVAGEGNPNSEETKT